MLHCPGSIGSQFSTLPVSLLFYTGDFQSQQGDRVIKFRPRPHISGYFLIRNFFFLNSIFPRPCVAYSNRIHLSTRILWYPDSLQHPGLLCKLMYLEHARGSGGKFTFYDNSIKSSRASSANFRCITQNSMKESERRLPFANICISSGDIQFKKMCKICK